MSYYAISANGVPWRRLTSAVTAYYAARIYLTNPLFPTEDGDVAPGALSLVINRTIADGVHEDVDVANHGLTAVRFNLEIAIRSDFANLFEVKLGRLVRRGRVLARWRGEAAGLETSYTNRDFHRSGASRFGENEVETDFAFAISATFDATVRSHAKSVVLNTRQDVRVVIEGCDSSNQRIGTIRLPPSCRGRCGTSCRSLVRISPVLVRVARAIERNHRAAPASEPARERPGACAKVEKCARPR